jgi:hypothetical protein
MTVNEIVERAYKCFGGRTVSLKALQNFLEENDITVNDEFASQIFAYYNRKVIESHHGHGKVSFVEDYTNYIELKKEMNVFINAIPNISMNDIIELKQKIDALIDAAILWSKK